MTPKFPGATLQPPQAPYEEVHPSQHLCLCSCCSGLVFDRSTKDLRKKTNGIKRLSMCDRLQRSTITHLMSRPVPVKSNRQSFVVITWVPWSPGTRQIRTNSSWEIMSSSEFENSDLSSQSTGIAFSRSKFTSPSFENNLN